MKVMITEPKATSFSLIETREINLVPVDGYYGEKQAWFTREQIGSALEYDDPRRSIANIHNRHKERFEGKYGVINLITPGGEQEGYVYNLKGVLEICRWSKQPKADMIMDALYDMAEEVMEKGFYSTLPDEELLGLLSQRLSTNPKMIQEVRWSGRNKQSFKVYEMEEQIRQLWGKRFELSSEDYEIELARICNYSTTRYVQEWRKYVKWAVARKKAQTERELVLR